MTLHDQTADQQHRDRIQQSLDENLFVEAGAGTGKTTALVGRIVTLIASGAAEMAGLAAIYARRRHAAVGGVYIRLPRSGNGLRIIPLRPCCADGGADRGG